ncbi:MAG: alpha-ketoglutarate-dependent dioxygenase AlkB [Alphaproteobacteria bacterium]|nr:alpha-ketoglutarate-dependent dioxygenase AlkB [Alphaproteobacteria bacterium]
MEARQSNLRRAEPRQLSLLEPEVAAAPGFSYRADFISPAEERELVAAFGAIDFEPFEFHGYLGKRRVVSFGLHYDFGNRQVRERPPIPDFLQWLRDRAAAFAGIAPALLRHALVIEYEPGAGIGWHRDRPVFGDVIGVSFLSPCRFRLRRRQGTGWQRQAVMLAPRSAYILRGAVRHEWEHSIPPPETLRYSVTFRAPAAEQKGSQEMRAG